MDEGDKLALGAVLLALGSLIVSFLMPDKDAKDLSNKVKDESIQFQRACKTRNYDISNAIRYRLVDDVTGDNVPDWEVFQKGRNSGTYERIYVPGVPKVEAEQER